MRKFKFVTDKSYKFWNIELQGSSYMVTYGRIGTKGQSKTKEFASAAEAVKAYDKIIAEKLGEGYVEITPPSPAMSTQEVLEKAILDDPDDLAAHSAYADWLSQQGDPRGEFMQVQLALEDPGHSAKERKHLKEREEALLKEHQSEWVGEWASLAENTGPEGRGQVDFPSVSPFRFIRGILAEVTLRKLNRACAKAFVQSPQTGFVRRLLVGGYAFRFEEQADDDDDDEAMDKEPSRPILQRWSHVENLRVFQLGWTSDQNYGDFCHFQCHLRAPYAAELVQRMPRLEELYLFADGVPTRKLFGLKLELLRVLQVYHCWDYPLEVLAHNPAMSKLTHLLLHPKADGVWADNVVAPYIKLDGVRAVLNSSHLTSLTHLQLRLTDIGDRGCEEIVKSGILKRLKILDLRHGCITDGGARTLAANPDLKNLKHLDVGRNQLTELGISALRAVLPSLRYDYQQTAAQIAEGQYLFQGDYE